jgi:glycosyltransferase involved in cell wall biosynthesis
LERRVVAAADLVTFNTERLRNAYSERYAELRVGKFVFIPNGIPIQATNAASTERESRFTISYTGSLYVGRSPEPVFAALAQLLERGTITTSDVRVRLIGQCDAINGYPTQDLIRRYGLDSVVEVSGPISYQNAIDVIRRSHLALLLAPDLPYQVPAKVYDYLGAGTRILAIAQDGATADLLRETDAGRAFRPQDVGGIAAFIQSQFESRDTIAVDTARYLCRFDPDMLTRDLLSHLAVNVPVEEAGAAS